MMGLFTKNVLDINYFCTENGKRLVIEIKNTCKNTVVIDRIVIINSLSYKGDFNDGFDSIKSLNGLDGNESVYIIFDAGRPPLRLEYHQKNSHRKGVSRIDTHRFMESANNDFMDYGAEFVKGRLINRYC